VGKPIKNMIHHEILNKINDRLDDGMDIPYAEANALMSEYNKRTVEIARLREALRSVLDWAPVPPDHWRAETQDAFMSDMMNAREVLNA
jgi:hypothetical protein